ncbi:MAG TPA: TadE/TadG family type IV pilus assembly protein [Gammaproteobacteria bacterium]|jgi:Flp pilus assembly protein TadG
MYSVPNGRLPIEKSKGAALIEFALTLPLYVAVLLAMIDFSNYLNDRSVLTAAAYNGAKMGAAKCTKPVQAKKVAKAAVEATLEEMLSVSDDWSITKSKPTGPANVRRYVVTVELNRTGGVMSSLFTSTIGFDTLSAHGVAVCQE